MCYLEYLYINSCVVYYNVCVSFIILKYSSVDWCTASASPGEHYMCVISAYKSAIVSPYTPACTVGHSEFTCVESSACVSCLHLFNL